MPNAKHNGRCECRKNARKAYKECVKSRKLIADSVLPNVRRALRTVIGIDRAVTVIATELRRQQLGDDV